MSDQIDMNYFQCRWAIFSRIDQNTLPETFSEMTHDDRLTFQKDVTTLFSSEEICKRLRLGPVKKQILADLKIKIDELMLAYSAYAPLTTHSLIQQYEQPGSLHAPDYNQDSLFQPLSLPKPHHQSSNKTSTECSSPQPPPPSLPDLDPLKNIPPISSPSLHDDTTESNDGNSQEIQFLNNINNNNNERMDQQNQQNVNRSSLVLSDKKRKFEPPQLQNKRQRVVPKTWIPWRNEEMSPIAFITHPNIEPQRLLASITEYVEAGDLILSNVRAIHISRDKIKIRCETLEDLTDSLNRISEAIDSVHHEIVKPKPPKVKIIGYPKINGSVFDLKLHLNRFNRYMKLDDFSIDKIFPTRDSKIDIILTVSPAIRSDIESNLGQINFGLGSTRCVDVFDYVYCSRCHSFSHFKSMGACQDLCKWCGGAHNIIRCIYKGDKSKISCATCKSKSHQAHEIQCEVYKQKLLLATNKVGYQYEYLMR